VHANVLYQLSQALIKLIGTHVGIFNIHHLNRGLFIYLLLNIKKELEFHLLGWTHLLVILGECLVRLGGMKICLLSVLLMRKIEKE
jgi:hypothetical protein